MEKIKRLRKEIKRYDLDGYIIPKNDEFFGEYVPDFKDRLKLISNFSGSYGFALITNDQNYLFVDGRYTLQAKIQSGSYFKIIVIPKRLPKHVLNNKKIKIGFDPKLHTEKNINYFFKNKSSKLIPIKENLVDKLDHKYAKSRVKKFYRIKDEDAGQVSSKKISQLVKILAKKNIEIQFISSPENVAWLLNLRGNDSSFAPIPNCYLIIDKNKNIYLFCDPQKINKNLKKNLKFLQIVDIKFLGAFLENIHNKRVMIDETTCSFFYQNILSNQNAVIKEVDPIYHLKSIKNKTEIKNIIKSHIFDGVALTKFLFWLKKNFNKRKVTEISAQEKLLYFRKKCKFFKFLSFPTISGSGPNGSIIHYKASKKSNRALRSGDLYLVDSGGQYNFGTTDVTRTISLNNNEKKLREIFTRVLKGHIDVVNFKLKKNTTGSLIDKKARSHLKKVNLDYPHGTGHGVGYFLNVHEGPQALSKGNMIKIKEGMILSNEPGYYEKNKFGIRIENLIRVKRSRNNLKFENLTLVPIDKSLIEKKLLNKQEEKWLNDYHQNVFVNLKKFMNKKEVFDLKESCSNI